MDISKWDVKELKALAYDLSKQLTGVQTDLQTVNRAISEKETKHVEPVPVNDSIDVPECGDSEPCDGEQCEGDVLPSECPTES